MKKLLQFVALAAFALAQPVWAQNYPTKSVRIIVPFAPGGSADGAARPVADKLGALLGQSFIVENRPGGAATIGALKAPAHHHHEGNDPVCKG